MSVTVIITTPGKYNNAEHKAVKRGAGEPHETAPWYADELVNSGLAKYPETAAAPALVAPSVPEVPAVSNEPLSPATTEPPTPATSDETNDEAALENELAQPVENVEAQSVSETPEPAAEPQLPVHEGGEPQSFTLTEVNSRGDLARKSKAASGDTPKKQTASKKTKAAGGS